MSLLSGSNKAGKKATKGNKGAKPNVQGSKFTAKPLNAPKKIIKTGGARGS